MYKIILHAKIISETLFRSRSKVNTTDDMVRVVLDMTRNEWRSFKKRIIGLK